MGPVSASVTVDAPRERLFEFLCDLANRPSFMGQFTDEFRLERLESSGVGAAARFRLHKPSEWMETVIAELEPPYRITERGRTGRLNRIPVATVWELVEGPGGGSTEVSVHFWTEPSNPVDIAKEKLGAWRRIRRDWRSALERLKDVIEGDRPVERVRVGGADRVPMQGPYY
jgi:uncharacterized protein YndB with AHSA1/START domain